MSHHESLVPRVACSMAWTVAASLATGCAATAAPTAPQTPAKQTDVAPVASHPAVAPIAPSPKDPFAIPANLQRESIPSIVPAPLDPNKHVLAPLRKPAAKDDPHALAVPPAPKACARYVSHKAKPSKSCATRAESLGLLDEAMAVDDPVARDLKLAALEPCAGLPAGIVRALRAELAPFECADALVVSELGANATASQEVRPVLFALALGSRLRRAAQGQPTLAPPHDKQRVTEFIGAPMKLWMTSQATAVEEISRQGAGLTAYARGVVAVEAGMADMRIVEGVRSVPLPEEYAKDQELKDAYFGSLEQSLDPRKIRGRDAALVGLRDLAAVGVISDARVDRARGLLSKMFGGRRIDALDAVALPPLQAASPSTVEQRLAGRLPTWYAGMILPADSVRDPGVFRQLLTRGVPAPMRQALNGLAQPPAELGSLVVRMRLSLGTTYWRSVDFDEAVASAAPLRASGDSSSANALMLALSLGLRGGPRDAAEMMVQAPAVSLGLGDTAPLDAVAAADPQGQIGAIAALDAAILQQVSPPGPPDPSFWSSVAHRYRQAAARLSNPALRSLAESRAKAAEEISAAAQSSPATAR